MFLRLCSIGGSPCVWANDEVAILSITMRPNNSAHIKHVMLQVNRFAVIERRSRGSVVQETKLPHITLLRNLLQYVVSIARGSRYDTTVVLPVNSNFSRLFPSLVIY